MLKEQKQNASLTNISFDLTNSMRLSGAQDFRTEQRLFSACELPLT